MKAHHLLMLAAYPGLYVIIYFPLSWLGLTAAHGVAMFGGFFLWLWAVMKFPEHMKQEKGGEKE
jgi:hypothetical protein